MTNKVAVIGIIQTEQMGKAWKALKEAGAESMQIEELDDFLQARGAVPAVPVLEAKAIAAPTGQTFKTPARDTVMAFLRSKGAAGATRQAICDALQAAGLSRTSFNNFSSDYLERGLLERVGPGTYRIGKHPHKKPKKMFKRGAVNNTVLEYFKANAKQGTRKGAVESLKRAKLNPISADVTIARFLKLGLIKRLDEPGIYQYVPEVVTTLGANHG